MSDSPAEVLQMPSPFPGMNPYIEQKSDWPDFHYNFIARMQEAIARQVGENYFVKTEERLLLHERSAEERAFFGRSDTGVIKGRSRSSLKRNGSIATAPLRLQLPAVDVEKQRFLEIRTPDDERVVTIIELLSPSNKSTGGDYDVYNSKRNQVLRSQTQFVEIDLRLGGKRPASPELPHCDYFALVSRIDDRPDVDVWPFALRDPMPTIPIPLLKPDPDIALNLKAVLDQTYDAIGLAHRLYYRKPEPPLSPADAEWAKQFLPKRRRSK
jgi:Protein of unknown function (DUF4058)